MKMIVRRKLEEFKSSLNVTTIKSALRDMDTFAREYLFFLVYTKQCDGGWSFTDKQRWSLLELFLGEFAFDYTHVDGYIDVILQDLKEEAKKPRDKCLGIALCTID